MIDIKERLRDLIEATPTAPVRGMISLENLRNMLIEAADHIEQQEAEIARLRKDADRYRWVKENADIVLHKEAKFSCDFDRYSIFGIMPCRAEIDSAIDYGMTDTSTQSTDQQNVSINGGNIDILKPGA